MLFKCDHAGYLLPPVSNLAGLPSDNSAALKEVVQLAFSVFRSNLLTVLFRGSQLFSTEHADFDIVIVTQREEELSVIERFRKESHSIAGRFDHITEIDSMVCSLQDVRTEKHLQFVVQVLSVRVFGKDLSAELQKFKADISSVYLHEKAGEKIDTFLNALKMDRSREQANIMFNYMIKYVIRSCFELVILFRGIFCRELRTCNAYFSELYPEMAPFSEKLLSQYNNKTMDDSGFLDLVTTLLSFSAKQISMYPNTLSNEMENS